MLKRLNKEIYNLKQEQINLQNKIAFSKERLREFIQDKDEFYKMLRKKR